MQYFHNQRFLFRNNDKLSEAHGAAHMVHAKPTRPWIRFMIRFSAVKLFCSLSKLFPLHLDKNKCKLRWGGDVLAEAPVSSEKKNVFAVDNKLNNINVRAVRLLNPCSWPRQ
jgi:hypothetical protein